MRDTTDPFLAEAWRSWAKKGLFERGVMGDFYGAFADEDVKAAVHDAFRGNMTRTVDAMVGNHLDVLLQHLFQTDDVSFAFFIFVQHLMHDEHVVKRGVARDNSVLETRRHRPIRRILADAEPSHHPEF
jgi:hypothetical protein